MSRGYSYAEEVELKRAEPYRVGRDLSPLGEVSLRQSHSVVDLCVSSSAACMTALPLSVSLAHSLSPILVAVAQQSLAKTVDKIE